MNSIELAEILDGRQYGSEITKDEEHVAEESGLVVVFGSSYDNVEFRGAISDEIGCYGGGTVRLTRDGLLISECDEDCPYFRRQRRNAATLETVWDTDGYLWTYRTKIPHWTFDVLRGREKYCRGIVFRLADVEAQP